MVGNSQTKQHKLDWLFDLLLIIILVAAGYLRTTGMDWDQDQHLHPDERFLSSVESAMTPVDSLSDYFNSATSTLNPANVGYGYYVYGTFPIILIRYIGEWLGQTGYGPITIIGRYGSAISDLLTIAVVYLIGSRLYDRRVGVLSAAFSAFAVLQIQVSHYFVVDNFKNLFIYLCIYFAILIATDKRRRSVQDLENDGPATPLSTSPIFNVWHFVLFGIAFGLAMASKVDSFPIAALLPLAVFIRMSSWTASERSGQIINALSYLVLGALISVFVFRIFQPYAFSGPGFFGIGLNENWVSSLRAQRSQATGDFDWPPSTQWARIPIYFSFQHLVLWGLGIPMSIFAWSGLLWVAIRMLQGQWRQHLLLWAWTASFFVWVSTFFNPTMRYQLPIYPALAVFAGWMVLALWDITRKRPDGNILLFRIGRPLIILLSATALTATALYAFAFTRIYTRPVTRVEASKWIYQNIPGPISLTITTSDIPFHQQIAIPYDLSIATDDPLYTSFTAKESGQISEVQFTHVRAPAQTETLTFRLSELITPEAFWIDKQFQLDLSYSDNQLRSLNYISESPILLQPESEYILNLDFSQAQDPVLIESLTINLLSDTEIVPQAIISEAIAIYPQAPYSLIFIVDTPGTIAGIDIDYFTDPYPPAEQHTLEFTISTGSDYQNALANIDLAVDTSADNPDDTHIIRLDQPVLVEKDRVYYIRLKVNEGGPLELAGSATANESTWDDGLPLRIDGYDGYGGIYQRDLVFEMYWEANEAKRTRFLNILSSAEYIFISSSRQWASTIRIPERYPLVTTYYRELIGCPPEKDIEWCYNVATAEMFEGNLGFELVKVFQSDPTIGSWPLNDQFSEEAFTVYDHPKVFIFKKSANYNPEHVTEILNAVDLSNVQNLTPKQASQRPLRDLLLPVDRLEEQREGGTWSELFNSQALINRVEILGVIYWYFAVTLLGLSVYPLLRAALPGLQDRGYPLARTAGLLLLSYGSWLAGSIGITFSKLTIGLIWLGLLVAGSVVAYLKREELLNEIKQSGRYYLLVEALFLSIFILALLIRLGNPDLWHPAKGGEKPMDFSYFNATLKSTTFPPYDPWYAGGYINYYYYGFVYVGTLVKFLGIVPSFAFNLILPTILALIALGGFSISWNLVSASHRRRPNTRPVSGWIAGLAGVMLMAILGNLGTLRMTFRGFIQIGAQRADLLVENAGLLKKWIFAVNGLIASLSGENLPYGLGDWYWIPSRVIRAPNDVEPITEFPMFTFTYADPHAHFYSLAIALLALSWVLSVLFSRGWETKRTPLTIGWSFVLGALAIGALQATNTWDYPLYLILGCVTLIYTILRHLRLPSNSDWAKYLPKWVLPSAVALGSTGILYVLFKLLWLPYTHWFVQGYTSIQVWKGTHTNLGDYITHWGFFLFLIIIWLIWETRQWLDTTPLAALNRLKPYFILIVIMVLITLAWMVVLHVQGIRIGWLVLPLGIWTAILLFRPGLPDSKRLVLFMIGTGLFLTLMVEIIVLSGDIGRMNTVFKFYLQVWTLFSVSGAAALAWTLAENDLWRYSWRIIWRFSLAVLLTAVILFPILGNMAKISDRMSLDAPHTLNGMDYMAHATYHDQGEELILQQDYEAIRWIQENIKGSPVIVEVNTPLYRWGSRYTIYTGLPGVVGWDWHQRQQRGFIVGLDVENRALLIGQFYETTNIDTAVSFLQEYNVKYIIVGQMEKAYHPGPGIEKFAAQDGQLWRSVFRNNQVTIYEVLPETLTSK
jgi:YYY domain-containing protein